MYTEQSRYEFIETRDGTAAALVFAEQTYKSYRLAVLRDGKRSLPLRAVGDRHFASLPQYRRSFIESYVFLKNKVLTSNL